MDNILDLLVEYSKHGRLVDTEFINKVVSEMSKRLQLEDYIKKVKKSDFPYYQNVIPNKRNSSLVYIFCKKQIAINELELKRNIRFLSNGDFEGYVEFEKYMQVNSYLLGLLLHEIELANQFKKTDISCNNLENQLLKICLNVYKKFLKQPKYNQFFGYYFRIWLDYDLGMDIEKYNMLVEKIPKILPNERIASIVSNENIVNMLESIADEIPNVYEYFCQYLIRKELIGYNTNLETISPTERFLSVYRDLYLNDSEKYFEIANFLEQAENASEEEKFRLGLNVSKKRILNWKSNFNY